MRRAPVLPELGEHNPRRVAVLADERHMARPDEDLLAVGSVPDEDDSGSRVVPGHTVERMLDGRELPRTILRDDDVGTLADALRWRLRRHRP
jgi:hypothetical protein